MTEAERKRRETSARDAIAEWNDIKMRLLVLVHELDRHNELLWRELDSRENEE